MLSADLGTIRVDATRHLDRGAAYRCPSCGHPVLLKAGRVKVMARRGPALGLLCHHEAGHAIADLALDERLGKPGPPIRRVVVRPRAEWGTPYIGADGEACNCLGIVERGLRVSGWQLDVPLMRVTLEGLVVEDAAAMEERREAIRPDVTADMLGQLAGPAAELRWRLIGERASLPGQVADLTALMIEVGRTDYLAGKGADPLPLLREAWGEAVELVNDHWRAISVLARRLQAQGVVEGEEVEAILARAMPRAFPSLVESVAGDGAKQSAGPPYDKSAPGAGKSRQSWSRRNNAHGHPQLAGGDPAITFGIPGTADRQFLPPALSSCPRSTRGCSARGSIQL